MAHATLDIMYLPSNIPNHKQGFTIVELLITIVVISILSVIVTLVFFNIQTRAEETKLKSDLTQASKQLVLWRVDIGTYPSAADLNNGESLKKSPGTRLEYTNAADGYCLSATSIMRSVKGFHVQQDASIREGVCAGHTEPSGPSTPSITLADEKCFEVDATAGRIRAYYAYQNNNPSEPACPLAVAIPATINGRSITQIGGYVGDTAFKDSPVTAIIIPDSVVTIGAQAFRGSNIMSVTIPNSVKTINTGAFSNSKLTAVTIPDSVTTIGTRAFENNQLTSVTLPKSLTTISELAFHTNKLTAISIPNSVKTIERSAFYNNQISSLQLGNSLERVNTSAFSDNKIANVTIPPSVTTLESSSFRNNLIPSVYIPDSVTALGSWAFVGNPLDSASIPSELALPSSSPFPASTTVTRR